jgi:hypothetical protein
VQVRESELKKASAINWFGFKSKIPGCRLFPQRVRDAWSKCRRRTVGGISILIKPTGSATKGRQGFALRAERGQHKRPAIRVFKVCGWEEISSCSKFYTKDGYWMRERIKISFLPPNPNETFPKKGRAETVPAFFLWQVFGFRPAQRPTLLFYY